MAEEKQTQPTLSSGNVAGRNDADTEANPAPAAAEHVAADQDVAIAMVGVEQHAIDPAVAARAVRKIDLFLIPAMTVGYGLVYYDKVCLFVTSPPLQTSQLCIKHSSLKLMGGNAGHPWICRLVRHDHRPRPLRDRQVHHAAHRRYLSSVVGDLPLLLRHASGTLSDDFSPTTLPNWPHTRLHCLPLGIGMHAHRDCHQPRGPIRTTLFPRLRRVCHSHWVHVHR